ncbi:glycoside hydrolase family 43 protein [Paramyrothecium foliicola]|nr:glycoside hydrolase family 43 protein [Paramyrothecium foliicola]
MSTFQCYPGVDRGGPDNGGIWAPYPTHLGEKFKLSYTDVKSFTGTRYYIVGANCIMGSLPEFDPFISSHFETSLLHDNNDSQSGLNTAWNHRASPLSFTGIVLSKFDSVHRNSARPRRNNHKYIRATAHRGPNLYKINGWYYLLVAEGGITYDYTCTLFRSRDIADTYETYPIKSILT